MHPDKMGNALKLQTGFSTEMHDDKITDTDIQFSCRARHMMRRTLENLEYDKIQFAFSPES